MIRGQALVEFALVLPLLLLLTLGVFAVGAAMTVRLELVHAAVEAADAGARQPIAEQRCDTALATLAAVYGRTPPNAGCGAGTYIDITAGDQLAIGGFSWTIAVAERAPVR